MIGSTTKGNCDTVSSHQTGDTMFILIGAVALLYMAAMGLYAIAVILYALYIGVKIHWSDL
jgi:hypothetical protein